MEWLAILFLLIFFVYVVFTQHTTKKTIMKLKRIIKRHEQLILNSQVRTKFNLPLENIKKEGEN